LGRQFAPDLEEQIDNPRDRRIVDFPREKAMYVFAVQNAEQDAMTPPDVQSWAFST
jgi:hypothetical protein